MSTEILVFRANFSVKMILTGFVRVRQKQFIPINKVEALSRERGKKKKSYHWLERE